VSGTLTAGIWANAGFRRDGPTADIEQLFSTKESRLAAASQVPKPRNDQAASIALLRHRYAMKPTPAKPRIIIAQAEGSGTALTLASVL
jgi:hypothetical protein